MTSNQLERLLRSAARQLETIAGAIHEGADLKDVCDSAYIVLGRTQQVVGNFDIPELIAADPRAEEKSLKGILEGGHRA